jgi:copper chaperone CopZ
MREKIQLDQIRCERCVSRLAGELSPIEGISEARIEMGTSSIIIEYVEGARPAIDTAFKKGGFGVVDRREMAPDTI